MSCRLLTSSVPVSSRATRSWEKGRRLAPSLSSFTGLGHLSAGRTRAARRVRPALSHSVLFHVKHTARTRCCLKRGDIELNPTALPRTGCISAGSACSGSRAGSGRLRVHARHRRQQHRGGAPGPAFPVATNRGLGAVAPLRALTGTSSSHHDSHSPAPRPRGWCRAPAQPAASASDAAWSKRA